MQGPKGAVLRLQPAASRQVRNILAGDSAFCSSHFSAKTLDTVEQSCAVSTVPGPDPQPTEAEMGGGLGHCLG